MAKMITYLTKNTKFQLFLILFLTFIAYSNIFQNQFVGDDINLIQNWEFIRHPENIPQALTGNVIPEPYSRFRPIGTTLLIIYYQISGSSPLGYHIHSILAYFIDIVLVYFITREIVSSVKNQGSRDKKQELRISKLAKSYKNQVSSKNPLIHNTYYLIPFLTALIFALHPVHSESVTETIVGMDGTGYVFFFASFYLYLKATKQLYAIHYTLYTVSLILAATAFFSYEITLVLPLMIILYDICFKVKSLRYLKLPRYLPYFALAGIYLIIRTMLIHKTAQAHYLADNFYLTMLTMTHVFIRYLELLIWPVDLAKNHQILPGVYDWIDPFTNMNSITSQSIFDVNVLGALGILGGLGWLGFKFRKKFPLVTFAIGWFFISLLPVSYIFPQDTLMQERYMFLGVYGFALILAWGLINLIQSSKLKVQSLNLSLIFVFCLLIFYGVRIYTRNPDFKDQVAVYSRNVSQNPNHIISNFMLAQAYQEKGDDENAVFYYQKTLSLEPRIPNIYLRLAEIYEKHGRLNDAISSYENILLMTPNDLAVRDRIVQLKSKINQ